MPEIDTKNDCCSEWDKSSLNRTPYSTENPERADPLAGLLYRLADKSYEMEVRRGAELDNLGIQLLTCITILSVAILTPASFLFDCYSNDTQTISGEQIRLAWMYAFVLVPQVIALLLILYTRQLKRMKALAGPAEQAEYIIQLSKNNEEAHDLESARQYCLGLDHNFKGMELKHNKVWKLLKSSMILMGASSALLLGFGLHLLFDLTW